MGSVSMATVMASLLGGVAAASVSAVFAKAASDKSIRIENMTAERKLWRDRLRGLVVEVNRNYYSGCARELDVLRAELEVRLNPWDPEDNGILDCLRYLAYHHESAKLDEFNRRMAMLLKHDWERAKIEASGRPAVGTWALCVAAATLVSVAFLTYRNYPDLIAELFTRITVSSMVCGGFIAFLVPPVFRLLSCLFGDLAGALLGEAHKKEKPCTAADKLCRYCAAFCDKAFRIPYSPEARQKSDMPECN